MKCFFDEFDPARDLFAIKGQTRSLAAYRQCKFYLILWNCWTKENVNCQNEHHVICEECEKGHAKIMYLNDQQPDDPVIPGDDYAIYLRDTKTILRNIRKCLEE